VARAGKAGVTHVVKIHVDTCPVCQSSEGHDFSVGMATSKDKASDDTKDDVIYLCCPGKNNTTFKAGIHFRDSSRKITNPGSDNAAAAAVAAVTAR